LSKGWKFTVHVKTIGKRLRGGLKAGRRMVPEAPASFTFSASSLVFETQDGIAFLRSTDPPTRLYVE
jgi:hypothetical protein